MAYQLRLDEMLTALESTGAKIAPELMQKLNALGDELGQAVAAHFGVVAGKANHDCGLTCVPFYPTHDGQPLPAGLQDYDCEEEFQFEGDMTNA